MGHRSGRNLQRHRVNAKALKFIPVHADLHVVKHHDPATLVKPEYEKSRCIVSVFWHRAWASIQRNAAFLAEDGFDALEIFFHENNSFLCFRVPLV